MNTQTEHDSEKIKQIAEALEKNISFLSDDERRKAELFLKRYRNQACKTSFYVYLKTIAPLLIPGEFKDGAHIRLFCSELEKLENDILEGRRGKLQFFLPPGAMKTLTLCLFVSWLFGRNPEFYVLHIGHTADFAENAFGQKIRDIINMPEYQLIFPDTKISRSTRSKGEWQTTSGGTYKATGVGNQIAGRRAHLAICDDVLSEQTAMSKTERTKINNWYIPGLRSRLLPTGSAEVIVNTRWNIEDLSGFIIKEDERAKLTPWRIISIPALLIGDQGRDAAKLLNLPEGGSYWPEYWKKETFEDIRRSASSHVWNALYMQNPVPEDGNVFKKHHFMLYDLVGKGEPECAYTILSVDTAFSTKESADYTAWGVWGVFQKQLKDIEGAPKTIRALSLIHGGRARLSYPELTHKIKELWRIYDCEWVIVEQRASGQSILQDLQLQGIPVVPFKTDMDKLARAHACVPFLEMGLVYVPSDVEWGRDFLTEMYQFPSGAHDDQVDQFTQAMLWMRDNLMISRSDYVTIERALPDDDDESHQQKPRRTYWNQHVNRNRGFRVR